MGKNIFFEIKICKILLKYKIRFSIMYSLDPGRTEVIDRQYSKSYSLNNVKSLPTLRYWLKCDAVFHMYCAMYINSFFVKDFYEIF